MTALRDTILIFRRQLRLSLRNPAWLIIGVIQPILYLTLFGPLVKHFVGAPGASEITALFQPAPLSGTV